MEPGRVWFYRPQWWWPTWSPITRGHDEYARLTLVIGWTFTGRIVIATRACGDADCEAHRDRMLTEMEEEA
jgi:hypothetical protein